MADLLYQNDDALSRLLDVCTGKGGGSISGTLRLFTAPATVDHTKVWADFTEATFAGYAGIALTAATWAAAAVAAHVASSLYGAALTFTRSTTGTAQVIYGWYLTDAANTKLYACALFQAGPYTMTNAGDSISVTPTLTYQSLN